MGRVRQTLWAANTGLVLPVGAARGRRAGRFPDGVAQAAADGTGLSVRPATEVPCVAEDRHASCLAGLAARPTPGYRRRQYQARSTGIAGGARRSGGLDGACLRTGALG